MSVAKAKVYAGKMNTLAWIQALAGVSDGAGGLTNDWATVYECFIQIEPWKGRERVGAGMVRSENFYYFYCRFDAGKTITNAMRVYFVDNQLRPRYFNIRAVEDVGWEHEFMQLAVEEGVAI